MWIGEIDFLFYFLCLERGSVTICILRAKNLVALDLNGAYKIILISSYKIPFKFPFELDMPSYVTIFALRRYGCILFSATIF